MIGGIPAKPVKRERRLPCVLGCLSVAMLLSGCGTSLMSEPVGIGPDRDQLKQSPCACVEIRQDYSDWTRS